MHGGIRQDRSHYGMEYTNPFIPWAQIWREVEEREAAKKKTEQQSVTPKSLTTTEKEG